MKLLLNSNLFFYKLWNSFKLYPTKLLSNLSQTLPVVPLPINGSNINSLLLNLTEVIYITGWGSEDWDQKRKGDVPVLISLSKTFKSVQEFLNEIVINNNFGNLEMKDGEKEKDCLIISTIHSAKGLEADSCFAMKLTISMNHLEWIIIERGYFPQNFNDLIVLY